MKLSIDGGCACPISFEINLYIYKSLHFVLVNLCFKYLFKQLMIFCIGKHCNNETLCHLLMVGCSDSTYIELNVIL